MKLYQKQCPLCYEIGQLTINRTAMVVTCTACGAVGIIPQAPRSDDDRELVGSDGSPVSDTSEPGPYETSIPEDVDSGDIVIDHSMRRNAEGDLVKGSKASVVYCPRPEGHGDEDFVDASDVQFDPKHPRAIWAKRRLRETVRREKRYGRDQLRRQRKEER